MGFDLVTSFTTSDFISSDANEQHLFELTCELVNLWDGGCLLLELRVIFGIVVLDIDVDIYDDKENDYGNDVDNNN